MTQVARVVARRLVSEPELDLDRQVLGLEDLGRAGLVDLLGLALYEQLELGRAVGRDERDRHLGRVNLKVGLGVAHRAEDPAPVGVLAVQGGLDQG